MLDRRLLARIDHRVLVGQLIEMLLVDDRGLGCPVRCGCLLGPLGCTGVTDLTDLTLANLELRLRALVRGSPIGDQARSRPGFVDC